MSLREETILLVYKDSIFQAHLRGHRLCPTRSPACEAVLKRLQNAHAQNCETLKEVEKTLRDRRLSFHKIKRGDNVDYKGFALVISVGGDGTFLDAAFHLEKQTILGVNSDPGRSVGRFCCADQTGFPRMLDAYLNKTCRIVNVDRIQVRLTAHRTKFNALNDILVCHRNPAFMSHYILQLGKAVEEQRSSGVWISTAAGSTGAIHSAGGKTLPLHSSRFQYMPRELYHGQQGRYHLTGAVYSQRQTLKITSLMPHGLCCLDGSTLKFPFPFGEEMIITRSPFPLNIVGI